MKIYLAARFGRRAEIQTYAKQLNLQGHFITSRWLDAENANTVFALSVEDLEQGSMPDEACHFANIDLADISASELVINFTERSDSQHGRGGRHVEFGFARALKKKLIVIGPRENVFHTLEGVIHFEEWNTTTVASINLITPGISIHIHTLKAMYEFLRTCNKSTRRIEILRHLYSLDLNGEEVSEAILVKLLTHAMFHRVSRGYYAHNEDYIASFDLDTNTFTEIEQPIIAGPPRKPLVQNLQAVFVSLEKDVLTLDELASELYKQNVLLGSDAKRTIRQEIMQHYRLIRPFGINTYQLVAGYKHYQGEI